VLQKLYINLLVLEQLLLADLGLLKFLLSAEVVAVVKAVEVVVVFFPILAHI
jgi:hypothetical protein